MRKRLFLLLLGLVLIGCTSSPEQVPSEWSEPTAAMFRADAQNSGAYQTLGVKQKPRLTWGAPLSGNVRSEVVVLDDTVYVSKHRSGLSAIEAQTGRLKWEFRVHNFAHTGVVGSAAVVDGVVYFGAFYIYFYAVEAETGEELWRYDIDSGSGAISSTTISSGIVYFKDLGGDLTALDAKTGQLLWRQEIEYSPSTPAVANGNVYVSDSSGLVSAFDGTTGEFLWEYQSGPLGEAEGAAPAVASGYVYMPSTDQHLYAIDAETGTLGWKFNAGGELYLSPALSEGVVYVSSARNLKEGSLHAIDGKTGEERWRFTSEQVVLISPVIADGYLYIMAVDPSAVENASDPNEFERHIYAFDLSTGEIKWQFTTQLPIDSRMTISDGAIYVGSEGGFFKFE